MSLQIHGRVQGGCLSCLRGGGSTTSGRWIVPVLPRSLNELAATAAGAAAETSAAVQVNRRHSEP